MYKIRKEEDETVARALHTILFPDTFWERGYYWVAYDDEGSPVGFATARPARFDPDGTLFLARAGVLVEHRGRGLHKRLLMARIRYGISEGYERLVTYVLLGNTASMRNLVRAKFLPYKPAVEWWDGAEEEAVFFERQLQEARLGY